MPCDTPDISPAALEALADRLAEQAALICERFGLESVALLEMRAAATLRALAAERAVIPNHRITEPPADVAALVEEARGLLRQDEEKCALYCVNIDRNIAPLIDRLAAALTAQAERAERAEALNREAGEVLEKQTILIDDMSRFLGKMSLQDYALLNEVGAARALAAKLKGEA